MIRTLIVDDEPLARRGLRIRLEAQPDIEIVGEAGSGAEAVQSIRTLLPDLVLLDIQMTGQSGLEVIREIPPGHIPIVVFVTAYDRYAVQAFELSAVDYLLKPVTKERFRVTLARVRQRIESADQVERHRHLLRLLERFREPPSPGRQPDARVAEETFPRRWSIRDGERILLLPVQDILWVESARNQIRIRTADATLVQRSTLSDAEQRLDPRRFARIHRSTIVNLGMIQEIRPEWHGDFIAVLRNGEELRVSRRYRDRLGL